jgi:hypothetical protein
MSDDDMKSTRVSERTTDRAPPPAPSIPPHVASYELGQMLLALDVIAGNIGGSLRGDVAELANRLGTQVRAQQAEFEKRIEDKLDLLIAMVRPFGQRLTLLEGNCNANHEHEVLASVKPPSSKHPTRAPEALER